MGNTRNGSVEDRIRAIVARQHGVISRGQLLEAGLSPGVIDGRVRTRRLRPLHRGVYLYGALTGPLRPVRSGEMAAVLACGRGSVVSHESAASLWDIMRPRGGGEPVHVTHTGGDRRRPGIRTHRVTSLPETHVADVGGIPVTAPARTLLDLAGRVGSRALEQAVARAERRALIDVGELKVFVQSVGPRPGTPALRKTLDLGEPALTRSEAEERFLALVRQGCLPAPRLNALIGPYEVDFLWPPQAVAVEVDGFAHHSSRRVFENDRRRDADLAARGIHVLRVTWRQLVDEPHAVLVRVARTLALSAVRPATP